MSVKNEDPKLPLKVLINRQKSKVLFAEANSDVVDILLSFLALPLGKIVRILKKHYGNETPVIGSLTTLYRGLHNLDSNHFCCNGAKKMLVNPTSSFEKELCSLQLDISKSVRQPPQYFRCQDLKCSIYGKIICMYSDMAVCGCGKPLNRKMKVEAESVADDADVGGVFTINVSSFIISDDLRVVPNVTGFLQMLSNLGITDTDGAELRSLSFGIEDIMELLKLSLTSTTPLTDLIIKNSERAKRKPEPRNVVLHENDGESSKKMVLKASLQKSTDKFLFAEATHEFVEFLFSFLIIPLGGVEYFLGGNTNLKNIDNLYESLEELIDDKYFTSPDSRNRLINPKLAEGYTSQNQFLPLTEEYSNRRWIGELWCSMKWRKVQGNYLKEQAICIVSDDLTVTPFTLSSTISILDGMGIPLSDVKAVDFHIGMEEAFRILNASLTSKTALTDALLINSMVKNKRRKLKQER